MMAKQLKEQGVRQQQQQQQQQDFAREAGVRYELQGRLQEIVDMMAATEDPTTCLRECMEYLGTHLGQVLQEARKATEQSPGLDALLADWRWAFKQRESGALDGYSGQYVAVLEGKSLAHGEDPSTLRESVARESEVHPERVVILFVDPA